MVVYIERDGALMVEREAHNLEAPGSKPGVAQPFFLSQFEIQNKRKSKNN